MLISFSVSNYRSFGEEQVVSLVANGRHKDHPDHLRAIPGTDESVLPVMALYGANAAGKSNLLRALDVLRRAVWPGLQPSIPTFMLKGGDCTMEVQFLEQDRVFVYGIRWSRNQVAEERLLELQKDQGVSIFERVTGTDGEAKVRLGPAAGSPNERLAALATVGARANHPFLRTLRTILSPDARGETINLALNWLQALKIVFPSSASLRIGSRTLCTDANLRSYMGSFLRDAGTGVDELTLEEREVQAGELVRLGMGEDIGDGMTPGEERLIPVPMGQRTAALKLCKTDNELHHRLITVQAVHSHKGGCTALPIEDESDGTRKLMDLLPVLLRGKGSMVVLIDEIDRSLHPQLSKHLVRQFLKLQGLRQLIFTTHDLNFLDTDLLRRDEIWFAEKKDGATELYSLADFKVRKDLSIDKAYLQGRFGAVPPVEMEWPEWVQAIRKELEPRKAE